MRWLALVVFAVACGDGATSAALSMDPELPPDQTALVVRVTYRESNVVALHVTGVALAHGRSFGPFDATSPDAVQSGATIGLLFDPADAGGAMVCIQARGDDGEVRASACGSFALRAHEVGRVELPLASSWLNGYERSSDC